MLRLAPSSSLSRALSLLSLPRRPLFLSLKNSNPTSKPLSRTHPRRLHGNPASLSPPPSLSLSKKAILKARRESPEGVLRRSLDMCSRRGDLLEALSLYDQAKAQSLSLSLHHYNVLLYLCTCPPPSPPRERDKEGERVVGGRERKGEREVEGRERKRETQVVEQSSGRREKEGERGVGGRERKGEKEEREVEGRERKRETQVVEQSSGRREKEGESEVGGRERKREKEGERGVGGRERKRGTQVVEQSSGRREKEEEREVGGRERKREKEGESVVGRRERKREKEGESVVGRRERKREIELFEQSSGKREKEGERDVGGRERKGEAQIIEQSAKKSEKEEREVEGRERKRETQISELSSGKREKEGEVGGRERKRETEAVEQSAEKREKEEREEAGGRERKRETEISEQSSTTNVTISEEELIKIGLERGFEIFEQMGIDKITPNEATFTSLARLAAAKQDPELAFKVIDEMSKSGIPPKLRSYGPALFGFCSKLDPESAYKVESHMEKSGVVPEEEELAALLKVSVVSGRDDQVYRVLHRLREIVRQVSGTTAEIVENWFESEVAGRVGRKDWDEKKVELGIVNGGGGWHGQGWLGIGEWSVGKTEISEIGVCKRCGEKLVSIDIDPLETENFAKSLASLAMQKEAKADFNRFQEWLECNGPFDAVIDGANVGLANQHHFSFFQLNSVVNGIRKLSPTKKPPLVVLHSRRVKGGPADSPNNKKLLESWKRSGALYSTPPGSNDDWYWLYAAVSCRSLLVTNDEMRDHLFQLLGTSFFPRWKEKHQVRMNFSRDGMSFRMPPPYSIVIQESADGRWHVPTVEGDDDMDSPRQWVCASRASALSKSQILVGFT